MAIAFGVLLTMPSCASRSEPRLHGVWRPETTATLAYMQQFLSLRPEQVESLGRVLDRYEVAFDQHARHDRLDDWKQTTPYQIVERGPDFCTVRIYNRSLRRYQTLRYEFEDGAGRMWEISDLSTPGLDKELFIRVP